MSETNRHPTASEAKAPEGTMEVFVTAAELSKVRDALEELLTAFDSDAARRYFTAITSDGWSMLEIGACSAGRQALQLLNAKLS